MPSLLSDIKSGKVIQSSMRLCHAAGRTLPLLSCNSPGYSNLRSKHQEVGERALRQLGLGEAAEAMNL